MVTRISDSTIDVRRDVVMFHTVLVIDRSKRPVAVAITTNPLEHRAYAQVVMHKSRSHGCSVQVARYVRRTFGIEEPVTTHRATRPVEVKIGWAAAGGMQHPPQEDTPWHPVVLHVAATPIADLLREVANGHSAARTRYVVYEVRGNGACDPCRGITHMFTALERRFLEAPPDLFPFREIVQVTRCATREEARAHLGPQVWPGDTMWSRKPDPEYVRRHLALRDGTVVWRVDGSPAVRTYDFDAVVIGPHVYTAWQVMSVLEHGKWPADGRSFEGLMAKHAILSC